MKSVTTLDCVRHAVISCHSCCLTDSVCYINISPHRFNSLPEMYKNKPLLPAGHHSLLLRLSDRNILISFKSFYRQHISNLVNQNCK